jgi:hypothetical protein
MKKFFLFAAFLLTPQAALSYDVAGWKVTVFPSSGPSDGCVMQSDFDDGSRVGIIMLKNYNWALGLSNPKWGLKPEERISTAAFVDGRPIAQGEAVVLSTGLALLALNGVDEYRALQTGRGLALVTARGTLKFSLTGTAKAMTAVLQCVQAVNGGTASPQIASGKESEVVSHSEATIILVNMLNDAQIRGYTLEPFAAKQQFVTFQMSDGSRGSFLAFRGRDTISADEAAASTIGIESSHCAGEFLSGKKVVPTSDGSVVRKVISTCRTASASTLTVTTIVRRSSGFLLTLSHVRPEASQPNVDAPDSSPLTDAAMRSQN